MEDPSGLRHESPTLGVKGLSVVIADSATNALKDFMIPVIPSKEPVEAGVIRVSGTFIGSRTHMDFRVRAFRPSADGRDGADTGGRSKAVTA